MDAETNQPDRQPGQLSGLAGRPPGGTVIRVDAHRQAIAAEAIDKMSLYGRAALIPAGLQGEIEAGVVIEYGQGMACPRVGREMLDRGRRERSANPPRPSEA